MEARALPANTRRVLCVCSSRPISAKATRLSTHKMIPAKKRMYATRRSILEGTMPKKAMIRNVNGDKGSNTIVYDELKRGEAVDSEQVAVLFEVDRNFRICAQALFQGDAGFGVSAHDLAESG